MPHTRSHSSRELYLRLLSYVRPYVKVFAFALAGMIAVGCLFNPFLHDHTEGLFYAWLSGLLLADRGANSAESWARAS